jgi:hypothetical protein
MSARSHPLTGTWVPHPQLLEGAGLDSTPPQTKSTTHHSAILSVPTRINDEPDRVLTARVPLWYY